MDLNNVPNSLMRGFSKEDFDKLLETLRTVILEECINSMSDYKELVEEIRSNNSSTETEKWINDLQEQVSQSTDIIKGKFHNIDSIFKRIFEDWEVYRANRVDNIEEKTEKEQSTKNKAEGDSNE